MSKRIICPSCGSTEVEYNAKTHMFHCIYCQTDFSIGERTRLKNKKTAGISIISLVVLSLCIIFKVIMNSGNSYSENKVLTIQATASPTITSAPEVPKEEVFEFDEYSDYPVWKNVLQNVFQAPYEEITKKQIESIRFLGFNYDTYYTSLTVQIGFQDYFEYEQQEEFNQTITEYELRHLTKEQYEEAYENLSMFQGITVLEINDKEVEETLLASFPNLSGLALTGCENPYFISELTNLKQLYLEGSSIREYMESLTNLTTLTLVNCDLDKLTSWMTGFDQLTTLNLKECKEVIPIDYRILAALPNLKTVRMTECEFDYELNGVLDIPNLTTLDLSGSQFYLNPNHIVLPETLKTTVLDNITIRDHVYEKKDDNLYYVQKNLIPVETVKKLLTP